MTTTPSVHKAASVLAYRLASQTEDDIIATLEFHQEMYAPEAWTRIATSALAILAARIAVPMIDSSPAAEEIRGYLQALATTAAEEWT